MTDLKTRVFRRKKKFIDPKFQLSFVGWFLMYFGIFAGLILMIMFIQPMADLMNPGINTKILMTDFFTLLKAKWPFIIGIIVLMGFLGNLFSHRIVGPEFRFKQILKSLKEKELNIFMKLRKFDYLKDLENYFRAYVNSKKESLNLIRENTIEAEKALEEGDSQKAKEAVDKIKKEISLYKTE